MIPKAYVVGLLVSLICTIGQAELLINGSFDEGTETTGYVSGNDTVTGWSHNGGVNCAMYHVNRDISDTYFPMAAPDTGPYYAGISASYIKNTYLYLSQQLGAMELGRKYKINGYVNNGGAVGTQAYGYWQVKVGSTVLGTGELNNTWQYFSFIYTANSTDSLNPTLYLGYVDDESGSGVRSSVLYDSVTVEIYDETIIVNGSFDEGTETTSYVSGNDTVTGWSHNSGTNCTMYHVNRDISSSTFPKAASDTGSYYAGISASYIKNAYLYLYQTLGTMEIGQVYKISGYVNNISGSAAAFGYWQVQIGTTVLGTGELNGTWQYFSFFYMANLADGPNPILYLGYVDNESTSGTTSGVLYDLVTVEIPEPTIPEATYLENGSFEEGIETNTYDFTADNDSYPVLDGWYKNGGGNSFMYHVNSGVVDGFFPQAKFPASSPEVGNYYAGITARYIKNSYLYLSRALKPLEMGRKYKISGYVNNAGTAYGYWQVQVGNTILGTGELNSSWQYFSYTYTANPTDGLAPTLYLGYVDDESSSGTQSSVLYDFVTVTRIPPAAPVFSPCEMYISEPTEITITSELDGAKIYYTVDGQTTPTSESLLYTGPVTVSGGTTLKAIAVAEGLEPSAVNTMTYRTPTIPIVAWRGIMTKATSLERFQELKEAGFTHQIQYPNIHFYTYSTLAEVEKALELGKEVGVKLFLTPIEPVEEFVAQFKDHPALEGYFITDEPLPEEFPALATQVQSMQSLDADHWCYINLYPNYAVPEENGSYGAYVDGYLNTVPTTILSFDHYPITGETTVRPEFYENLEVISQAAREAGKPFWAFALATAHLSYPVPTLAHLRYQVYSNLAYGAQGIQYYTYWTPFDESYHDGALTKYGERTDVYYRLQTLNQEVQNLSRVFLNATVLDVRHTGISLPTGTTAYTNSAPINSLTTSGSDGAVVSRLTNGDNDYLVVVNRDIVSTMTLNIGLDTSKTFTRVSKGGSETAISGGTVSYTVDPADIVILKWSNVTPRIPGDANEDGVVNVGDLGILAANYGRDLQAQGVPQAQWWGLGDFNNDGVVNVGDLGILAANYGSSGSSFEADYAKVFGTMSDDSSTDDDDDIAGSLCGGLGLPLVAGLLLMGLMLIKLDE